MQTIAQEFGKQPLLSFVEWKMLLADNGVKYLAKLGVTVDVSFTVGFITWTWVRACFCFSMFHVSVWSSSKHCYNILYISCQMYTRTVGLLYINVVQKNILIKIDLKFIRPSNENLQNIVKFAS